MPAEAWHLSCSCLALVAASLFRSNSSSHATYTSSLCMSCPLPDCHDFVSSLSHLGVNPWWPLSWMSPTLPAFTLTTLKNVFFHTTFAFSRIWAFENSELIKPHVLVITHQLFPTLWWNSKQIHVLCGEGRVPTTCLPVGGPSSLLWTPEISHSYKSPHNTHVLLCLCLLMAFSWPFPHTSFTVSSMTLSDNRTLYLWLHR